MGRFSGCGGWSSYYGPCGAYDCSSCYPGGGDVEPTRDLSWSGYEFEPETREWWKDVSVSTHVCRRPHRDGKVQVGQTYRKRLRRIVNDETGEQRHERLIRVLQ
jgi:hypothetical protein